MIRVHLHLSDKQLDLLRRLAKAEGLPIAEMVRRAIDFFLSEQSQQKENTCVSEK
jgi:hypothetical protein